MYTLTIPRLQITVNDVSLMEVDHSCDEHKMIYHLCTHSHMKYNYLLAL